MTIEEIKESVCTGKEKNPDTNLRGWLNALVGAKILIRYRIDDKKLTSNGSFCYRVVKDIGPKAPVSQVKSHIVLNPNNGEIYPTEGLNTDNRDSYDRSINSL
jgi:hypothetical protein